MDCRWWKCCFEKLVFLLKSTPRVKVKMIAPFFRKEVEKLAKKHRTPLVLQLYRKYSLHKQDLVIVAINSREVNQQIYFDCKMKSILVNVAHSP